MERRSYEYEIPKLEHGTSGECQGTQPNRSGVAQPQGRTNSCLKTMCPQASWANWIKTPQLPNKQIHISNQPIVAAYHIKDWNKTCNTGTNGNNQANQKKTCPRIKCDAFQNPAQKKCLLPCVKGFPTKNMWHNLRQKKHPLWSTHTFGSSNRSFSDSVVATKQPGIHGQETKIG